MSIKKKKTKKRECVTSRQESYFENFLYNKFTLILSILGVAFGVYFTFANPQQSADKIIASIDAKLAQHAAVQDQSEANIRADIKLLRDGDLKDLKADVLENRDSIVGLQNEVVKLQTIIEERIPKKK